MTVLLRDDFRSGRPAGGALGPARQGDPARGGVDVEGIMSVDGGALRIAPPLHAGWGRTCLCYGPYPNEPGLAIALHVLNGHNTSQSEVMADTLGSRLRRWARGSGAVPVGPRLRRWLTSGRVRRTLRQVRWWRLIAAGSSRVRLMDENLAVGLFPAPNADPEREGAGFIMHADGPRNGELRVGSRGEWAPAVLGVQNVPVTYVAIVRERDVLLGAASLPGAYGFGAHPCFRPLGLVPRPTVPQLYAGLQQAVLGQIGFRADTRVHGVRVSQFAAGGAGMPQPAAADRGLPGVALAGRAAEAGGPWRRDGDRWFLEVGTPIGLIVCRLDPTAVGLEGVAMEWGGGGAEEGWRLRLTSDGAALSFPAADSAEGGVVVRESWPAVPEQVQVLFDDREIAVLAAGRLLFGKRLVAQLSDTVLPARIGIVTDGGTAPSGLDSLEVFARELSLPAELVAGTPWQAAAGPVVAADQLTVGDAGSDSPPTDLDGCRLSAGDRSWRRLCGSGLLEAGPGGARWRASPTTPLPDRTIYAIEWTDPGFAALEVTLTPPGTARGQREHGTAGFCLWQDPENYLLVNTWLDDGYGGASLSSFFTLDGFEDLYDAIWTNVGERVTWGRPVRLGLVSDGLHYTVSLDGEPVLHRSLADVYPGRVPLRITKVGLLGNWEWGADTGSSFRDFRASGAAGGV